MRREYRTRRWAVESLEDRRLLAIDLGASDFNHQVGLQSDDSVVVLAHLNLLTRFDELDQQDLDFGSNGSVLVGGPPNITARLAIDSLDRIVVAADDNPAGTINVFRYLANGEVDPSFGQAGVSVLDEYALSESLLSINPFPDGSLLVLLTGRDQLSDDFRQIMIRLTDAGTVDQSFGSDGAIRGASLEDFGEIAISPQGIVAGMVDEGQGIALSVRRYTLTGQQDPGFGIGGETSIELTGHAWGTTGLAVQENGSVILAAVENFEDVAIYRLTSAGEVDTTFGADGKVTYRVGIEYAVVAGINVQQNGKIVVGMYSRYPNWDWHYQWSDNRTYVTRMYADGQPDWTFGSANPLGDQIPAQQLDGLLRQSELASDGSIVLSQKLKAGLPSSGPGAYDLGSIRRLQGDPLNLPPTDITLSSSTVVEGAASGVVVGKLDAVDNHPTSNGLVGLVDPTDLSLRIENRSDKAVSLTGYWLQSDSAKLSPSGWRSISDWVLAEGVDSALSVLGPGPPETAANWQVNHSTASMLAEHNYSFPSRIAPGESLYVGKPFLEWPGDATLHSNLGYAEILFTPPAPTLELIDSAGGRFRLADNQLVVDDGALIDFENAQSYKVVVRATDQGGLAVEKTFDIAVTNANEPPTNVNLSNRLVERNSPPGTVVGELSALDPDANDQLTFKTDSPLPFSVQGNQLVVSGVLPSIVDSWVVLITATDKDGLSVEKGFVIEAIDRNVAPSDISLDKNTVAENAALGTIVGELSATDDGGPHTYLLLNDAGGRFQLAENQVVVAGSLNFETATSHDLWVKVTDSGGLSFEKTLTIYVTNVNERPLVSLPPSQVALPGQDLALAGITLSDPDLQGPDLNSKPLRLTLEADQGTVQFGSLAGLTVIAGANGSSSVTVEGALNALNAALASLTHRATNGFTGLATLAISLDDRGHTGEGLPLTDVKTLNIPISSPPVAIADRYEVTAPRTLRAESFRQAVLASNPTAYWRLGDGGPLVEAVVGGFDGAASAATVLGVPGAVVGDTNTAASFLDVNSRILVDGAEALAQPTGAFSVEAWVNPSQPMAWQRIASTRNGPAGGWGFALSNQRLTFTTFGIKDYFLEGHNVPLNQWSHVAVVFDVNHDAIFFLNGAFVGKVEGAAAPNPGGSLLAIGDNPDQSAQPFLGKLDEVAFYSKPLEAAEVRRHYQAGLANQTVLVNDTDADGDSLQAILVAQPLHGTLQFAPDGSFIYKPNAGFVGQDRFTYRAVDAFFGSPETEVLIDVTAVPGDADGDGDVDLADFGILKQHFGAMSAEGDFNGDGKVDLSDFGILKTHFGTVEPE